MTDGGEEYKLRIESQSSFEITPELEKLIGKRICAKGIIHKYLMIISEYSVVNLDKDEDIVEMKRKLPDDMTSFSVGDRVRHRKRGLAFQQIEGRIDKIDRGLMYVKWDGVKEFEVFSLSDPVAIHGILQKL
jgi:muconolactone delta-isomerase